MSENLEYTFNVYQSAAEKTAVYKNKLIYPTLGLTSEAGELAGKVKKILRDKDGKLDTQDREEITKELGDILWYISACASDLGVNLNTVAIKNLEKLSSRQERDVIGGSGDNR
jgi:NTP pyrophosphatase (non-canonical NTP hydrolase)